MVAVYLSRQVTVYKYPGQFITKIIKWLNVCPTFLSPMSGLYFFSSNFHYTISRRRSKQSSQFVCPTFCPMSELCFSNFRYFISRRLSKQASQPLSVRSSSDSYFGSAHARQSVLAPPTYHQNSQTDFVNVKNVQYIV